MDRSPDWNRFHSDASLYARGYDGKSAEVAIDLTQRIGPIEPVLDRLDRLLLNPPDLSFPLARFGETTEANHQVRRGGCCISSNEGLARSAEAV